MSTLLIALHNVLCMIKDFSAGYTTKCSDKMVIRHKNKFYEVHFKEIEPITVTEELRDQYKIYDDDETIILSMALQNLD